MVSPASIFRIRFSPHPLEVAVCATNVASRLCCQDLVEGHYQGTRRARLEKYIQDVVGEPEIGRSAIIQAFFGARSSQATNKYDRKKKCGGHKAEVPGTQYERRS